MGFLSLQATQPPNFYYVYVSFSLGNQGGGQARYCYPCGAFHNYEEERNNAPFLMDSLELSLKAASID